jgi:hypothetical protein
METYVLQEMFQGASLMSNFKDQSKFSFIRSPNTCEDFHTES